MFKVMFKVNINIFKSLILSKLMLIVKVDTLYMVKVIHNIYNNKPQSNFAKITLNGMK